MTSRPKPLVLCILDGWGERPNGADNAIDRAKTPVWHELMRRWPHAQLEASEHYVGLPDGQMGNSEVGHTNLGAGRIVLQDLPRIDKAIAEGKLAAMPALKDFIAKVKASRGTAHVMGLVSPGGVHSHQRQIAGALLDPDFDSFKREKRIAFAAALGLTEYSEELNPFLATLFPPQDLSDTFGELIAGAGMKQLRIAETEKYAHVTFFFNGGR